MLSPAWFRHWPGSNMREHQNTGVCNSKARQNLFATIGEYFMCDPAYDNDLKRYYDYAVENVDKANDDFRRDTKRIVEYLDKIAPSKRTLLSRVLGY